MPIMGLSCVCLTTFMVVSTTLPVWHSGGLEADSELVTSRGAWLKMSGLGWTPRVRPEGGRLEEVDIKVGLKRT